jgi:uncharacterized protein DUF6687
VYIEGTKMHERPDSRRTIFADGAGTGLRDGIDVELSHWVPNRTPAKFKADTSTEICMNFVAAREIEYDLVVNNHADVDGLLSVFTLLYPETATAHRAILVSAARMGDFWDWGESAAQVVFQSLTQQIDALTARNTDSQIVYEQCLAHVSSLIERGFADRAVEDTLAPLKRSVDWIADSTIERRIYHSRFVHYAVPMGISRENLDAALRVPAFNAAISDDVLIWPQARARWDREKVQLVTIEAADGTYYDLWYPSYLWAETPNSWRAPGLDFTGNSNGYGFSFKPLEAAAREFQQSERNDATWRVETDFSLFSSTIGRGYPVVLTAMNIETPATSSLKPDFVADRLADVFSTPSA